MTEQATASSPNTGRDPSLARPVAARAGWTPTDVRTVDTARVLAAEAVEKVGNGHPGTAMWLARSRTCSSSQVMRLDPAEPSWLGRDRFVMSAGHASLTQYFQLYLNGFGLELNDIESLRTWGSQTPGHPEYRHTKRRGDHHWPAGPGHRQLGGLRDERPPLAWAVRPHATPGERRSTTTCTASPVTAA